MTPPADHSVDLHPPERGFSIRPTAHEKHAKARPAPSPPTTNQETPPTERRFSIRPTAHEKRAKPPPAPLTARSQSRNSALHFSAAYAGAIFVATALHGPSPAIPTPRTRKLCSSPGVRPSAVKVLPTTIFSGCQTSLASPGYWTSKT